MLGRSAISPNLGRVALCSSCPLSPVSAVSLITWAGCSRIVPCVICVCSPVIVEPCLLLACQWVELTLRMTACENWPHPQHRTLRCEWVSSHGVGFTPVDFGACQDHLLSVLLVSLTVWCSVVVRSWRPSVLRSLEELQCRQRSATVCVWPGAT